MTRWADAAAQTIAALGVLVLVAGLCVGARFRLALPVALELWTAAGLLRLSGTPSWSRVATAATVVAVRHMILWRRRGETKVEGIRQRGKKGPPPSAGARRHRALRAPSS